MITKLEKEAEEDCATWESATQEILSKSAAIREEYGKAIREEYGKALALFGAELSPFPSDVKEGASGLLDWLLAEFEGFGEILTSVSDNTAVMASESDMAILAREGCQELQKITARDYVFPEHSDLEDEIAKVQVVKKFFLHRFWKVSGRQVVQEAAQQRVEEVCSSFSFDLFGDDTVI